MSNLNSNKDKIVRIIRIIGIILVFLCVILVVMNVADEIFNTQEIAWNGYNYYTIDGLTCVENTQDTLKLKSPFGDHDVEARKSTGKDSKYNQLVKQKNDEFQNAEGVASYEVIHYNYNESHVIVEIDNYLFILPNDVLNNSLSDDVNFYQPIGDNVTVIEFTSNNVGFLSSFVASAVPIRGGL